MFYSTQNTLMSVSGIILLQCELQRLFEYQKKMKAWEDERKGPLTKLRIHFICVNYIDLEIN